MNILSYEVSTQRGQGQTHLRVRRRHHGRWGSWAIESARTPESGAGCPPTNGAPATGVLPASATSS